MHIPILTEVQKGQIPTKKWSYFTKKSTFEA